MTRDINDLLPIVKQKCEQFISECKVNGIELIVTSVYRSVDEQNEIYAQGRTKPGNIVTNAKGGQSYHNHRVAFDVVPLVQGKAVWNNNALWSKIGGIGQRVGLEWGGSWASFPDVPHFQYTLGYTWQNFIDKKVDMGRFNLLPAIPSPSPVVDQVAVGMAEEILALTKKGEKKAARDKCSYLFNHLTK